MLQPKDIGQLNGKENKIHIYMPPSRDPSQIKRYTQAKSKQIEKDISCKWKGKESQVAVLTSDKINFKTKAIVRDKGYYII